VTTTGATKGTYYPIYLGDFKQYATMFQRQRMEIRSTDIGGNAWKTNSVEVRAIARKDASVFDSAAVLRREIFIPA
jgi:HK97 family phage major capsid protein